MPPPRIIERHAGIVMLPEGTESQSWAISVDEQGPFPSKYDIFRDPSMTAIGKSLTDQQMDRAPYRPELRELPVETGVPSVPASLRGERFFPEEPVIQTPGVPTMAKPLGLVMIPLSSLPKDAWPSTFPDYLGQIPPAMAAKTWRFMLELGEGGRVVQQLPIDATDDAAVAVVIRSFGDWLGHVKFGPSAKPGWIGVEIALTRAQ